MPYGHGGRTERVPAELLDYSAHGVRIRLGRPIAEGVDFMLSPSRGGTLLLSYVVRNCREAPGGFEVGGELSTWVGAPDDSFGPVDVLRVLSQP